MKEASEKREVNRTTFKEKLKITDYCRSRLDYYRENRTSRNETVKDVLQGTGIEVSKAALMAILSEAEVVWDRRPDKDPTKSYTSGRGAGRLRRLAALRRAIIVVGKAVEGLYKELNVDPPGEFAVFMAGELDFNEPITDEFREAAEIEARTPITAGKDRQGIPNHPPRSARGNVTPGPNH